MDEEITGDSERRKKGRAVVRRDKKNKGKKEVRRISKREEQKKKERKKGRCFRRPKQHLETAGEKQALVCTCPVTDDIPAKLSRSETCHVFLYSRSVKYDTKMTLGMVPLSYVPLSTLRGVESAVMCPVISFLIGASRSGRLRYRAICRSLVIYPCLGSWCDFAISNPVKH